MKWISLEVLFKSAGATFWRFPLSVLSSFFAALMGVYIIEDTAPNDFLLKMLQVSILGVSLFLAIDLYTERNMPFSTKRQQFRLFALIFLVVYFLILPDKLHFTNYLRYGLWLIAFHLLVSIAPYLFREEHNGFWQFNQILFIRILLSFLYTSVLYFGISIALISIDQLFNINIRYQIYLQLWVILVGVFNTLFFLASVPNNFEYLEEDTFYPIGLKIFTQYVLIPLVTLYLLILYVYTLKILFEWSLPKGGVSVLVIAFSGAGIFSLLLIHPIRELEENKWIKIFGKWFYRALLPLLVLLFVAIGKRIWDYGVTEFRYYVIVIACWLAGISFYFLFNKIKNIKIIPISLCLIAFFTSFGPWGVFYISERSQVDRLARIFEHSKMLRNGKVFRQAKPVSIGNEDAQEIASIMNFLRERDSFNTLQPYFAEDLDSLLAHTKEPYEKERLVLQLINSQNLTTQIGTPDFTNMLYFSSSQTEKVESVSDFDFRISYSANQPIEEFFELNKKPTLRVKTDFEKNIIQIFRAKSNELFLEIDLNLTMKNLISKYKTETYNVPPAEMTVLTESAAIKVKLKIINLDISSKNKTTHQINNINGVFWVKFK